MSVDKPFNIHDIHTYPGHFIEPDETPASHEHAVLQRLDNIHTMLQSINRHLSEPVYPQYTDERYVQPLWKPGLGQTWIPNRRGKFYLYVWGTVATALNVTTPIGPPFVLTVPAPTLPQLWNLLDIPDQSSVTLDSTASANMLSLYVLLTNEKM